MKSNGYILVYTTSSAFKAEKILKNAGMNIKLVPTPRHLSSDCGISVYFEAASTDEITNLLDEKSIEYEIGGMEQADD